MTFADHSVPISLTFIDWIFNNIRVEMNAFWLQITIFCLYGVLNISYVKITGIAIYPPLITWDSPKAWGIGLVAAPIFVVVFFFTWYVTKIKCDFINERTTSNLQPEEETKKIEEANSTFMVTVSDISQV